MFIGVFWFDPRGLETKNTGCSVTVIGGMA